MRQDRQIAAVFRQGRRQESEHFFIYQMPVASAPTRFCLRFSRRIGNAVCRNRIKRYLREFLRTHKKVWPKQAAVVIKVKSSAAGLNYRQVADAMTAHFHDE
ncbi:MAG: ribonuclease P protein component [candidate division Zixibacteria bacterium]|nr:ribonuclease P protein component [candidate division Zixibacteria bacterium]